MGESLAATVGMMKVSAHGSAWSGASAQIEVGTKKLSATMVLTARATPLMGIVGEGDILDVPPDTSSLDAGK